MLSIDFLMPSFVTATFCIFLPTKKNLKTEPANKKIKWKLLFSSNSSLAQHFGAQVSLLGFQLCFASKVSQHWMPPFFAAYLPVNSW